MKIIKNEAIEVRLDSKWPRIISIKRLENSAEISCCSIHQPFNLELNGENYGEELLSAEVETGELYLKPQKVFLLNS